MPSPWKILAVAVLFIVDFGGLCGSIGAGLAEELPAQDAVGIASDIENETSPEVKEEVPDLLDEENRGLEADTEDEAMMQDREQAEAEADEFVHSAESCPEIFGDPTLWDVNRQRRKANLVRAFGRSGRYTIQHRTTAWDNPRRLRIEGIEAEGVVRDEEGHRHVLLVVSEDVAGLFGCDDGVYELERDNALLRNTAVLKILDDVVLLEYRGRLMYLPLRERADPTFRLAWQSRWSIPKPRVESSKRRRNVPKRRNNSKRSKGRRR